MKNKYSIKLYRMFSSQPSTYNCGCPIVKETLPPSALGYHANNKYDEFPPLMSDGRVITASYQPEAVLNEYLLKEIGVESNWQYRQYLIKNAKEVMKYNCIQTSTDAGYIKRYTDLSAPSTHSTPYRYPSLENRNKPTGYSGGDLKELYLSREQLQSRMVAPEITQAELYNNLTK
jgi:hypothetical protein